MLIAEAPGYNSSYADTISGELQKIVSIVLPADKAEITALDQRVSILEVRAESAMFPIAQPHLLSKIGLVQTLRLITDVR